ncbi:hypothetical protein [Rhodococcus aetherivorans]|uniref:hypothetical protein n=1 Tax=Rhodococcus aetherivorans TaxID=191292 RepID=UPI00045CB17B|nr:hypothetical protein [Rhodococcus aetherivorans]KDE12423.1 hypothetical protein N505_0115355 [Rhodococcus aetherivorans]
MTNEQTPAGLEWITTAVAPVAPGWTIIREYDESREDEDGDYETAPLLAWLSQELRDADGGVHERRVVPADNIYCGELDADYAPEKIVRDEDADAYITRRTLERHRREFAKVAARVLAAFPLLPSAARNLEGLRERYGKHDRLARAVGVGTVADYLHTHGYVDPDEGGGLEVTAKGEAFVAYYR